MTPEAKNSLKKRDISKSRFFLVMGVSGCGKSTLAQALAEKYSGIYIEGDDFHSPANKAKMTSGLPLSDDDRAAWLSLLNKELKKHNSSAKPVFLACSALKQNYRDRLNEGLAQSLTVIYLRGSLDLIRQRLSMRRQHFMPIGLLQSQFDILEEPQQGITLNITPSPEELLNTLDLT